MIVYLGAISLLIIISFITDSDRSKILNKISLFLILPILVCNYDNPDFEIYSRIFEFGDIDGITDKGFLMLINFIKYFGGNSYRVVLIILGMLILITFLRYSKYIFCLNYLILLYFIFPFMLDVIQIRNAFMFFLFLNAILEYVNKKKLLCLLFLIVGATFHSYGIIYIIIFIFMELYKGKITSLKTVVNISYKNNKKFYNSIIIASIINIIVGRNIVFLIMNYFPMEMVRVKLQSYVVSTLNLDSFIVWCFLLLMDYVVFYNIIKQNQEKISKSDNSIIIFVLYFILLCGFILLGSMLYLHEFNRFFRALFVVKYLLYCCLDRFLIKEQKILMRIYLIIVSLILSVFFYSSGIEYDHILFSNILFK